MSLALADIFRVDFRTSAEADAQNTTLQKLLKLDYRYQPARLGLALSLADPSEPTVATDLIGKPIRGETIFGQEEAELALWIALLVEHGKTECSSRKLLIERVGAHWQRGVSLLTQRHLQWCGTTHEFLITLADDVSINDKVVG